jgi:hypothetical protein
MSSHQEKGEKNPTTDSKRPSDSRATEEVVEAPKLSPLREKLTLVGHYIMLGLAPVIAVCALGVAIAAVIGNQAGEEQLSKSIAKIDSLSVSLASTKGELEKLKVSIAQEKGLQEEERKKQEERLAKIVQNITPLQLKLKISHTLEEQLRQTVAVSAVMPTATSSTTATVTAEKKPSSQVQVMKEAIDKYNKNN